MSLDKLAEKNMRTRFVQNPCRGIVIGMNNLGRVVQMSWIMGRSENSQNRVYVVKKEDGVVRTEAADPSKVKDPRLIIYNAMLSKDCFGLAHIVSNGDQTDTIADSFGMSDVHFGTFVQALEHRHCEPDAPIFTPRISGYVHYDSGVEYAHMSILKADPVARKLWLDAIERNGLKPSDFPNADEFNRKVSESSTLHYQRFPTLHQFFKLPLRLGFGYCLTTYQPGFPQELRSFEGEPFLVPLPHSLEENMNLFWHELNPDWRVSLAGKEISTFDGSYWVAEPINKFERSPAK